MKKLAPWIVLISLQFPTIAGADEGFGLLTGFGTAGLGPRVPQTVSLAYEGWLAPDHGLPSIDQNRLTLSIPLSEGERDTWTLSTTASLLRFNEHQALSPTTTLAKDFWKIETGGQFSRKLSEDRTLGFRLGVGSASDHPFSGADVMTYSFSGFYSFKTSETERWVLMLITSNNNSILEYVPIPGFLYLTTGPKVSAMLGIPVSAIRWKISDEWLWAASFFGPNFSTDWVYGKLRSLQYFALYSWGTQAFLRARRAFQDDRLNYREMKTALGVRAGLPGGIFGELSGGYLFARRLYEGARFGSREDGNLDLAASWFAQLKLKMNF